jgi:paraquat-inducible protein B
MRLGAEEHVALVTMHHIVSDGWSIGVALDSADTLLASQGVSDLPPKLAAAVDELNAFLAELRDGGAVANVNATLASADRAADAVTAAAADLPALVAQLTRVANQADVALGSVSPGSQINRDTLQLIQEVREAARSINALVQALERRPNSVLFGR